MSDPVTGVTTDEKAFKSRWRLRMKVVAMLIVATFLFREASWAIDPTGFKLQRERQKEGKFLPRYLLEQQQKHEEFVQHKEDLSDLSKSL